jgi:glutathione S-transferase
LGAVLDSPETQAHRFQVAVDGSAPLLGGRRGPAGSVVCVGDQQFVSAQQRACDCILITIPLSHYCEKARWALDRSGIEYREQAHAPLIHRLVMKRGDKGTVPVLVHLGQRLLASTDILVHVDKETGGGLLYPRDADQRREVDALVARFDQELGPHTRRWAYEQLLPRTALLSRVWRQGVPWGEALCVPLLLPLARPLVRRAYRITRESAARSLERVRAVFAEVDTRLRDGRRFLVGDAFSAADLTFATLAAPMVFPLGCRAAYPSIEEVPAAMREEALRLRQTASGLFVQRLYRDERGAR